MRKIAANPPWVWTFVFLVLMDITTTKWIEGVFAIFTIFFGVRTAVQNRQVKKMTRTGNSNE